MLCWEEEEEEGNPVANLTSKAAGFSSFNALIDPIIIYLESVEIWKLSIIAFFDGCVKRMWADGADGADDDWWYWQLSMEGNYSGISIIDFKMIHEYRNSQERPEVVEEVVSKKRRLKKVASSFGAILDNKTRSIWCRQAIAIP